MYECLHLCICSTLCSKKPEGLRESLVTGITSDHGPLSGCWGLNPCPLEERRTLLTASVCVCVCTFACRCLGSPEAGIRFPDSWELQEVIWHGRWEPTSVRSRATKASGKTTYTPLGPPFVFPRILVPSYIFVTLIILNIQSRHFNSSPCPPFLSFLTCPPFLLR